MNIRKIILTEIDDLEWIDDTLPSGLNYTHLDMIPVPHTKYNNLEDYIINEFDSRFFTILKSDGSIVDIMCDLGDVMVTYYDNFLEYSGDMGMDFEDIDGFFDHFRGYVSELKEIDPELYDIFLRFYPNTESIYVTIF
jgi:hypothetical protein